MSLDGPARPSPREALRFVRHASARWLVGRPPFSTRRRAVRLDVGAVDGHAPVETAMPRDGLEHGMPQSLAAPPIEAVVDRCIGAIGGRAIPPACARAQHMNDPADDTPIVHPMRAPAAPRQKWLQTCPFCITHPVELGHVLPPSLGRRESQSNRRGNQIRYRP